MASIALPDRPFTTREARQWGMTRTMMDDLVASRRLIRVLHGVYQHSEVPMTASTRVSAAQLVIRPHVVICDRTAAWLHGVDTFDIRELAALPPIDTCVTTPESRVRRKGCNGTRRGLEPVDVMPMGGLSVTTPLRTAHDLGRRLQARDALAALDGFRRLGLVTEADLIDGVGRHAGQRGIVQLRRLAPLADPLADSPGESWTRLLIIDAGLPTPELQIEVWADGRLIAKLDLGYAMLKVGVEFDGVDHHSSLGQRAHDAARRERLAALGWTIVVVRKEDFGADRRHEWIDEVRRLVEVRERLRGQGR
jgi:hypothetical protein